MRVLYARFGKWVGSELVVNYLEIQYFIAATIEDNCATRFCYILLLCSEVEPSRTCEQSFL